jgi:hypothetical protein
LIQDNILTIICNELSNCLFFQVEVGKLFGSHYPCTSGGGKCKRRKNNDHWTEDEMIELVEAVSKKRDWEMEQGEG